MPLARQPGVWPQRHRGVTLNTEHFSASTPMALGLNAADQCDGGPRVIRIGDAQSHGLLIAPIPLAFRGGWRSCYRFFSLRRSHHWSRRDER